MFEDFSWPRIWIPYDQNTKWEIVYNSFNFVSEAKFQVGDRADKMKA